ncbi:MAG: D-alanine--D-alanine ligase [Patescibacteria group bacterium]
MKKPKKKLKVAILFGGKSVEHEVSLRSARNIAEAMDKDKYDIVFIGIDKKGNWLRLKKNPSLEGKSLVLADSASTAFVPLDTRKIQAGESSLDGEVDVVFPVLHGTFGEDGTVQGLLKLKGIPFVGCSVLGSAVAFDKDVTKRLLTEAGIPNSRYMTFKKGDVVSFSHAKKKLGLPLFIKPANSGSSVGVSKAATKAEFDRAVEQAFLFDRKILIEEFIDGREVECAVLGNDDPVASVVGEVITNTAHGFYSYEAKYLDENGAAIEIPAKLSKTVQTKIQKLAVKTFQTLCCEGLSRVDCFVTKKGKIYVNEVNTLPGFTNISMYPSLWKASGLSYSKLIDRLIMLAIERFTKEKKLRTSLEK